MSDHGEGAVVSQGLDIVSGNGRPRLVTFGYSDDQACAVGLTRGGTIHVLIVTFDRW